MSKKKRKNKKNKKKEKPEPAYMSWPRFRFLEKLLRDEPRSSEESSFFKKVKIFRSELDYISRCILDYPDIETGGQLFGLWMSDGTPEVCYAIGPGPNANHQAAFFNQDVAYLEKFGQAIIDQFGLQHIGEWHSHHQLGLAQPSGHDASTMYNNIKGLGNFILCIGNCDSRGASMLNAFAFNECVRGYKKVPWHIIENESPVRALIDNAMPNAPYQPHTRQPNMQRLLTVEMPMYSDTYWMNEKSNRMILKQIIDFVQAQPQNQECTPGIDEDGYIHLSIRGNYLLNEIFFPKRFPKVPPQFKPLEGNETNWDFNGDIYLSFVEYYKNTFERIYDDI